MHRQLISNDKSKLRKKILAVRNNLDASLHYRETQALIQNINSLELAEKTVFMYLPTGSEPGSMDLILAVQQQAQQVLLPVILQGERLGWAKFIHPEKLVEGIFRIPHPTGPILPPATISYADLILIPSLAVDKHGVRLGKGGGFYDQTLAYAKEKTELIAIIRDEEFVDELPAETHDIAVHGILTPGKGLVRLPSEGTPNIA